LKEQGTRRYGVRMKLHTLTPATAHIQKYIIRRK
jgi:hypothetical protein